MPTSSNTNTSQIALNSESKPDARETMISVEDVSMVFNMASEQLGSLKEYFITLMRGELRFKELRALDHVSFEVKRGDVFGIMGTNGSGKSTMLKIVAGVLEPTEGKYTVNGNIAPLIELGAGFDYELTARENIFLNGALLGYPKPFIEEHFQEIVDFAEVENFLDMPMKNYSSGMVARIAFAIATVIIPEILIVDEVLSVGDFMFQQKCERRIQSLIRDHGVTVLIVSHSNDQIERLCNKAIWIEKGHTRIMGSSQDVCRLYRVLGGRTGSIEAEQKIIECLNAKEEAKKFPVTNINGEDHFGTVMRINNQLKGNPKNLIVAPVESAPDSVLANCLASVLDDPQIILARQDDIPDLTMQSISGKGFERAWIVSNEANMNQRVEQSLATISTIRSTDRLPGEDPQYTSSMIYEIGLRDGNKWGDTAIVASNCNIAGIISMYPYMLRNHYPLFITWLDGEFHNDVVEKLSSGNFKRIIFLDGPQVYPQEVLEKYEHLGLDTLRIFGDTPMESSKAVNAWLIGQQETGLMQPTEKTIIISTWNLIDGYVTGPYSLQENAMIIVHDPSLLESMAGIIEYGKKSSKHSKELICIGINELDSEIFEKAFSMGCEDEA